MTMLSFQALKVSSVANTSGKVNAQHRTQKITLTLRYQGNESAAPSDAEFGYSGRRTIVPNEVVYAAAAR